MLTPEYMANVSDSAEKLATQLHEQVMKAIIRRLMARAERGEDFMLTSIDRWNVDTIQQAGYLYEDVLSEISKKTGETTDAVKRAMKNAGALALKNDQKIYDLAGIEPIDISKSAVYMQMIEADYIATNGTIKNLTRTTADVSQRTFINQCDMIYMSVTRGAESYESAIKRALDYISSDDGVHIVYPSGHKTSIEAAVTRCVRTGVAQMAGHISEKRAKDVGCEYYLVSSHCGARPEHQVWQGKVYKINGSDDKYANFAESTGYGTGAGLCGWNCRHSFTPFFPEFMKNNQEHYNVTENEEEYNKRQERKEKERKQIQADRKITAYETAKECTKDDDIKRELGSRLDAINETITANSSRKQQIIVNSINDKSIENIKRVMVPDASDKEIFDLQLKHKKLLEIAKNKNNSYEVAMMLDENLTELCKPILGTASTVNLNIPEKSKAVYVLHNHPNNSSFSNQDLLWFVKNDITKYMTIVKNNGDVEILYKTELFDKKKLIIEYKRAEKKYYKDIEKNQQRGYDKLVTEVLRKTKSGLMFVR